MFQWRSKTETEGAANAPEQTIAADAAQAAQALLDMLTQDMRGLLPQEKIPPSLRDSVVLLSMGMMRVAIVAEEGASAKAQYNNLRLGLSDYRILREDALPAAAFARFKAKLAEYRGANFAQQNEEDRGKRLFEELVYEAYRLGASDLHFRLREQGTSDVRLRLFGRMRQWQRFDSAVLINAVSSAYSSKTKFGTNSRSGFELGVESSTITEHHFEGKTIMGRFSHRPVLGGGKTVVRLLETSTDPKQLRIKDFEELGYAKSHAEKQIKAALRKNTGLILMSGTTGSGKSTTLRTMMHTLLGQDQLEMYSVEDPTEYVMPWVNQISIQSSADDSDEVRRSKFLSSLRSMMRMDPDVAMIGEIRDTESARIATEMTQTGHRVLSTVHGDGAVDVMARLTGELLQVPPEVLAGKHYLSASIYQKLMPLLCPHCKRPATQILPQSIQDILRDKFQVDVGSMYCANESGCEHCHLPNIETHGTKGQTVVAEIITPNDAMRALMRQRDWFGLDEMWRLTRRTNFTDPDMTGKTAFEHALFKACAGLIDPLDIEMDFEPFESYEVKPLRAPQ